MSVQAEPWFRSAIRAAAASTVLIVEPATDEGDDPLGLVAIRLDLRRRAGGALAVRALAHQAAMSRTVRPSRQLTVEPAPPGPAWRELLAWAPGAPLVGRSLSRTIGPIEASLSGDRAALAELARRERADLLETIDGLARHGHPKLAPLSSRGLWEVAALAGIVRPAEPGPFEIAVTTARVWALLAPALCDYARRFSVRPAAAPSDPAGLPIRLGPGVQAPHADLAGADLHGLDLTRADLAGADLAGADLGGADLGFADLAGANLAGAVLVRANLAGANLTGADLSHADLAFADLSDADLTGARTVGVNLPDLRAAVAGSPLRR